MAVVGRVYASLRHAEKPGVRVNMDKNTKKLLSTIDKQISILKMHGESHWLKWLEEDKRLIEQGHIGGIEHLLSAFGAMGSINDLYLCKENGHLINDKETSSVNEEVVKNNIKIYDLATKVKQHHA